MLDQRKKTDYVSWAVLIALLLFFIEISFFHPGLLFSIGFSVALLYIGKNAWPRKRGKILFWLGCIGLVFHLFAMMTARFIVIALLFSTLWKWFQSKQQPAVIRPVITEAAGGEGEVISRQPLFHNMLFGRQTTPAHVYEWNDVNIQTGIGDTVIDVSNTVLPKGEAVIIVRGLIGHVRVLVPYEVETKVVHSAIFGGGTVLGREVEHLLNQTFIYQTPSYEAAERKLKIVTSMVIGHIEVKRL
ncbi:cell wall-active antibiotics response protein LiaF [Geobacillus jurassicus]|uniref:Cell wall-active antibiotics response protein LiaF n=1 Tax=Geobacillus jurassicus TaxID=235932 RepID=A0ABV6GYV5_9BACL|nr:cell wall-active antibiotics response protein LiaF [Geobacillus jurassicus]